MIEASHIHKFAAVFAEAVLTFLDSGEAQWLTWDGHSHRFDFTSVELDDPDVPAMMFVDASWTQIVGDINEATDPDAPDFNLSALRDAIEEKITEEGYGERLLKRFQERLARIDAGEEDVEEDGYTDGSGDE